MNSLGFLHNSGIETQENESFAKVLFKRSADLNDYHAQHIYSATWNNRQQYLKDLFRIAIEGCGEAVNQIGCQISNKKHDVILKSHDIATLLFKYAALLNSAYGMYNSGTRMKDQE